MGGVAALVTAVDGGARPGLVGIVDRDDAVADRQSVTHREIHQAACALAANIVVVRGLATDDAAQCHEAVVAPCR